LPYPLKLIGIVGKTNVGKSTFFSAATLMLVPIANRPFVTIEPNVGIAYVRRRCVCVEFGVKCRPQTGFCIDGNRFIPIKIVDVAGLIPGAHMGRGLGNKFLDEIRKADALIHVVDVAGATDPEGHPCQPGSFDPVEEVRMIEEEIDLWFESILRRDWQKLVWKYETSKQSLVDLLYERLSGLSIKRAHIVRALAETKLESVKPSQWSDEDFRIFTRTLRRIAKPMVIAANKIDLPGAEENFERLKKEYGDKYPVIPCSAEAELALRKAPQKKLIRYLPGDPDFEIIDESRLTEQQLRILDYIREHILGKWGSTGVQTVLNTVVFEVLKLRVVYPVEDPDKLTDHHGNVLPDAYLVEEGTTVRDLAYMIHTELGKTFLYAIDVRTKRRLSADYVLQDNDVISIVAACRRKT